MSKERIFPPDVQLEALNSMGEGCMVEHLGIVFTEVGTHSLTATMPVDKRTKQPMGLLHGGASVALSETMGSVASVLCIDLQQKAAVGLEINANHIKSAKEGVVTGVCSPIHIGRSTHVWNIEIKNDQQQLVAISRITVAIIDRK